jgi:hypothetical protein
VPSCKRSGMEARRLPLRRISRDAVRSALSASLASEMSGFDSFTQSSHAIISKANEVGEDVIFVYFLLEFVFVRLKCPYFTAKFNKYKNGSRMLSSLRSDDIKKNLQIEHLSSALNLLAVAARRGAFSIEEFSEVSSVYGPLDAFVKIWREELLKEAKSDAAQ